MGSAIARWLIASDVPTHGFDVSEDVRAQAGRLGVKVEGSPREVAERCEQLLLSLPNAEAVEAALFGRDGVVSAERAPDVVIDMSTIRPDEGRAFAERLGELPYLDAPVSGGPSAAGKGALTIMCGGTEKARRAAAPLLELLAKKRIDCGGPGAGQAVKLVNNALVAAHLALARDALALGKSMGLGEAPLLDALNASSGRSAVTEVNLPDWVLSGRFDSGFSAGLMRKDIRLAMEAAGAHGLAVPMMAKGRALWEAADDVPDDADFNRIVRSEAR